MSPGGLPGRGSCTGYVFAAYIEAHIDATDPTRDPVAHVVKATQAVPGAAIGVGAAIFLGWPVAVVCAAVGALLLSQRYRLFAVARQGSSRCILWQSHLRAAASNGRCPCVAGGSDGEQGAGAAESGGDLVDDQVHGMATARSGRAIEPRTELVEFN
jgi:hypothetical protein